MRYLLDAHPNLACPPESKFIAGLHACITYPQAMTGLLSLGVSVEDVYSVCRRVIERTFQNYARQRNKKRWVDKTPNHYRLLPFIDRVFAKTALYVLMVRNPFDTVESLRECSGWRTDPDLIRARAKNDVDIYSYACHWADVNTRLLRFRRSRSERCILLTYETLVREPETTIDMVLQFMGECMTPGLVADAFTNEPSEGYGDSKIKATSGVHASSVGKRLAWTREDQARVWELVEAPASELGYRRPENV